MLRKCALATLVLFVIWSGSPAQTDNKQSKEITGIVVAYDDSFIFLPCGHGCWSSLIVRLNDSSEAKPRYVRVFFRYARDNFPKALVETSKRYRFSVVRTKEDDAIINEFVPAVDEDDKPINVKLAAWKLIRGAEGEKLPFGDRLPAYTFWGNVAELISEK